VFEIGQANDIELKITYLCARNAVIVWWSTRAQIEISIHVATEGEGEGVSHVVNEALKQLETKPRNETNLEINLETDIILVSTWNRIYVWSQKLAFFELTLFGHQIQFLLESKNTFDL